MGDNKGKLFREKNLEKIESPEALNDYLQVTSPGVWLVLTVVVVFLAGACIWGVFGHIDSTLKVAVIADGRDTYCLVPEKALTKVLEDRLVTVDDKDYDLEPRALEPESITDETNIYWILAGDLKSGDIVYRVPLAFRLEEGVYTGSIVTETLSPVSLLMN